MPNTFNAEIDKLRSAYEAAVAAGDASAMSPLLEEGAVFVRPGAPEWAAMAAAAPGLPFPPGAKIAISPIEVVELSKEWAYEFGTSTTTYTPQGSQAAIQLHDTYLVLFRNTQPDSLVDQEEYDDCSHDRQPPRDQNAYKLIPKLMPIAVECARA